MEKKSRKKKRKVAPKKPVIAIIILAAAAVLIMGLMFFRRTKETVGEAEVQKTAAVTRQSITSELSSSGTLQAKDTYTITSLVEGEVISANFEEGDQVVEGQVLYEIDPSSIDSELTSATNSLTRAEKSYSNAQKDYSEAASEWSGNTYKATETGYIKNLYIEKGDKVSNGSQVADIYSDAFMELRVPFLREEAAAITVGSNAIVTLTGTGEQLPGMVSIVSSMDETLTGGRLVRYVTITVSNPGGMTTSMAATAEVGEFVCSAEGTFTVSVDKSMNANFMGNGSVEVANVLVNEGDYVTEGTPIFSITADSAEDLLGSYEDAVEQAEENLENAQNKLESTQDSLENYTITAPISGEVIQKSVKAGDNVSRSGSSETTLAVIYDLSALTFEMSIDELDIQNVKVGQRVEVTADAYEGQTFTGTVTNVSLQSSYSNGVTNYPVTVTLDETGDLLPGMNVDGTIIIDEAEDVLTIPVDSLMRGNRVYVKDSSVTESVDGVPAGFRAVEVTTGLTNDEFVEIVDGLSEGDEVYVSESTASSAAVRPVGPAGGPTGGPGGGPGGGGPGGRR